MRTSPVVAVAMALVTIALAVLIWKEAKRYKRAESNMPKIDHIENWQVDELIRTAKGHLSPIMGTGSMRPLIPAGKPDEIVAWVEWAAADFDAIKQDDLLIIYRSDSKWVIHQASERTALGWITTGSANRNYDSTLVTAENFLGKAVHVYVIKK